MEVCGVRNVKKKNVSKCKMEGWCGVVWCGVVD